MLDRIERLLSGADDDKLFFISSYPNIFYYSGFTSEDAYLMISKNRRILVTDSRYTVQARNQAKGFDIVNIADGWEKIFKLSDEICILFEDEKMSVAEYKKLKEYSKNKIWLKEQSLIDMPRRIKDKNELRLIAEAEKLGDDAFSHVLNYIKTGMTEREVALELEIYMKKHGASGLSFDTIVASGVRSSMPHGVASDKVIERGDFVTMDFGCVYNGYCSDMTRTIVMGEADEKQREIYDIVLKSQLEALNNIKIGMNCSDADRIARNVITNAGYGAKFGHSLGHSVGIEIHEKPLFSPRSTDILEEGHVLSVEPGIYIDGFGGVRIEDLIGIIDGKMVNFTSSPKELVTI